MESPLKNKETASVFARFLEKEYGRKYDVALPQAKNQPLFDAKLTSFAHEELMLQMKQVVEGDTEFMQKRKNRTDVGRPGKDWKMFRNVPINFLVRKSQDKYGDKAKEVVLILHLDEGYLIPSDAELINKEDFREGSFKGIYLVSPEHELWGVGTGKTIQKEFVFEIKSIFMYPHLTKLGLRDFIVKSYDGQEQEDKCFRSLDNFVGKISQNDTDILKLKFNNQKSHMQKNDILNELKVKFLFHPNADFVKESEQSKSSDLYDKKSESFIEIKTLRESQSEQYRHAAGNQLSVVGVALTKGDGESAKSAACANIKKKANGHLQKASKQLSDSGIIYLIWDYDNLFTSYNGIHRRVVSKEEVGSVIGVVIKDFEQEKPDIRVRPYYFEDINQMVVDRDASSSQLE